MALNLFVGESVVSVGTFSSAVFDLVFLPRLRLLTLSAMALNLFVMPSFKLRPPRCPDAGVFDLEVGCSGRGFSVRTDVIPIISLGGDGESFAASRISHASPR